MRPTLLLSTLILVPLAIPALIGAQAPYAPSAMEADCDVRRIVEQDLSADGLTGVLIDAAAGSLEVSGGSSSFRVRGVICASSDDLASRARLIAEPRRDAAWIEADLPEASGWGNAYVRMDLTVEMPSALAADIRDGSGSIDVRGIEAVRIDDGSGSIEVRDIAGLVEIDDGSGSVRIRNVGSVLVDDGSGEVEVVGVRGDVRIAEDGSGELDIREVAGDVRVDEDGSGTIHVEDVGGDFVVMRDGSGSISHREIQGRVSLPDHRR